MPSADADPAASRVLPLPTSKHDFPKLLCLDTNIWIALGRAHYEQPEGRRFMDALAAVRSAIQQGKLIVPVLTTPVFDSRRGRDFARRERLATFMVELSGNTSMIPHVAVQPAEMRNAIRRQYLGSGETEPIRASVLRRGMSGAFGDTAPQLSLTGDPVRDAVEYATISSPEISVHAILNALSDDTFSRMRAEESTTMRTAADIRRLDAQLSPEDKERLECSNWLTANGLLLWEALTALEARSPDFLAWIAREDNLRRFCLDIPSLDVLLTLMVARDRNAGDATDENDGLDWRFLQTVIPYGNIVATENRWAHLANSTRLAVRSGTRVIADAAELPLVLAQEGCL